MSTPNKPITNEDLLETMQTLMQMTSDGFMRLEKRVGSLEVDVSELKADVRELKSVQYQHTRDISQIKEIVQRIESEQQAQRNDIAEILDRLAVLEEKVTLSEADRQEMRQKLEYLIKWAIKVADHCNIPLELPKMETT